MGDGLQPRTKAPRGVVDEILHLGQEQHEHALGHLLGIGILELPVAAPLVDPPAILVDELAPGILVGGARSVQPAEQASSRGEVACTRHR